MRTRGRPAPPRPTSALTRREALRILAALSPLLATRRAFAYIPSADFLLTRVAEKRKAVRTVELRGIHTFVGRSYEDGKQDVTDRIFAGADGPFRLERRTPKGEYLEVSDGKRRVRIVDGKAGPIEPEARPLERLLLLGGPAEEMIRAVQAFGIRTEVVSLGRVDGRVCWRIGGKEGEAASPTLLIDKERSVPLVLDDPRTKRRVRFEGWGEAVGAGHLPAKVVWSREDAVEQELKVEEVRVNPKLAPELFDPERPAPIAPPAATPTTPAPGPSPSPAKAR